MKKATLAFVLLAALIVPAVAVAQVQPPDVSGSWWYQILDWAKGFLAGTAWSTAKLAGLIVILTAAVKVLAVLVKLPGLSSGWPALALSAAVALLTYVIEAGSDAVVTGAEAATFLQTLGAWIVAALAYRATLGSEAQAKLLGK